MSYEEKNTVVSLMSTFLVFGYYIINVLRMYQEGSPNPTAVYSLWATVIVLTILVSIIASILTHITTSIIHAIRTGEEDEDFMEDERDKFIQLKGTRNAYYVFSGGVLLSMLTMVMNVPVLVMFNLLMFSAMLSSVMGDISRLYFYRRGF